MPNLVERELVSCPTYEQTHWISANAAGPATNASFASWERQAAAIENPGIFKGTHLFSSQVPDQDRGVTHARQQSLAIRGESREGVTIPRYPSMIRVFLPVRANPRCGRDYRA